MNQILGLVLLLVLLAGARFAYSRLMTNVQSSAQTSPFVWPTPVYPMLGTFSPTLLFPTPSLPGRSSGPIAFPR